MLNLDTHIVIYLLAGELLDNEIELIEANDEVIRMLNGMIRSPEKFVLKR